MKTLMSTRLRMMAGSAIVIGLHGWLIWAVVSLREPTWRGLRLSDQPDGVELVGYPRHKQPGCIVRHERCPNEIL